MLTNRILQIQVDQSGQVLEVSVQMEATVKKSSDNFADNLLRGPSYKQWYNCKIKSSRLKNPPFIDNFLNLKDLQF